MRMMPPLIPIRLGQHKGVLNHVDFGFPPRDAHFGDVEPVVDLRVAQQLEPGERSPRDELLFGGRDGFGGFAIGVAGPRFDFDEHQRVVVAADQIDFAAFRGAVVVVEHFVARPPQVLGREPLPLPPQGLARIRVGRVAVEQPAKSFGDGSDKAHGVAG